MAFFKVHETMRPVIIWEVQDFFRYTILSRINFCLEVSADLEVLFCSRMVCVFPCNLQVGIVFYLLVFELIFVVFYHAGKELFRLVILRQAGRAFRARSVQATNRV